VYYIVHRDYTYCNELLAKLLLVVTTSNPVKIRDLPPTAVRLRPELRAKLAREAAINGRSMHAEIVIRLTGSLEGQQGMAPAAISHTASERLVGFGQEKSPAYVLSDIDRAMLSVFRAMPPEKQLALLSLFK
jgi:hypothetical protein